MNKLPCGSCAYFDPIGGTAPGKRVSHGQCVKRSVYPMKEAPGQAFPAGVQRMTDPKLPAKPFVVEFSGIISHCTFAKAK